MRDIFLNVLVTSIPITIRTQQINAVTIREQVTDQETGASLADASVFLANTTFGTSTWKDGESVLNNVPYGSFDIVFNCVGHIAGVRRLSSYTPGVFNYDISMKPKEINLNEVTVTGIIPKDWREELKIFIKVFIGETDNSKSARILNPEVLDLMRGKNTNTLRAYSYSLIAVENDAPGYMIYISLDSLVYDICHESVRYKFYPGFTELHPSDR